MKVIQNPHQIFLIAYIFSLSLLHVIKNTPEQ